jgi:CO/xanthine dehydrogenase Mo-binding subunit
MVANPAQKAGQPVISTAFGARYEKVDGYEKVTGVAQFGADYLAPGMLHGKFVRSPHAHARIVRIDTAEAEKLPGVHAVITAADFPATVSGDVDTGEVEIGIVYLANLVMARRKVLFQGHPVAAVAASDPHIAEQAAALVKVEYEVLPPVTDPVEAMSPAAPLLHEGLIARSLSGKADRPSNISTHLEAQRGDFEAGFRASDIIVERTFRTSIVHQGYIEPEAETAWWQPDGRLTVWGNTQGAFSLRGGLANLLGIDAGRITVIPLEVGGAFGGKLVPRVSPVAALLSRKSGRPVKIVLNRTEVLQATGPGAAAVVTLKVGAARDGRLKAAQARIIFAAGAFPGAPVIRGLQTVFACYQPETARVDAYDVVTNTPRVAAYRAPGATVTSFCTESVMDELASKLGMDPIDFRLKNATRTGDKTVDGLTYTRIGIAEMLDAAKKHPAWTTPLLPSPRGWPRGRGLGIGWWPCGIEVSSVRFMVNQDGSVELVAGNVDLSGVRTGLAQIAAETLRIEPSEVHVTVANTDQVPYTGSSAGSRVTRANSDAIYKAGQEVIRQMREKVAQKWGVQPDAVEYREGAFVSSDNPDRKLTFKQAGKAVTQHGSNVVATASNNPNMRMANGYALNIADVEVDPDTGKVELLKFTAFQDVGRCVNPTQVEGQIQGGATQGIGWAMNEEYVYDDRGILRNASLLDYRMPTALDLPMLDTVILETPADDGPFGIRGVGEPPIIPPAGAIANAIAAATGVRLNRLPLSPERVFWGMRELKGK